MPQNKPKPPLKFSGATKDDHGRLIEIWEAAVRATHAFLTEDDIQFYRTEIRDKYLDLVRLTAVRAASGGPIMGFMGLTPPEAETPARVEMLFVDPAAHGRGFGRALIERAAGRYGPLELEVNEQNPGAAKFYQRLGFEIIGRQELDGQGRPFPLLCLRREDQQRQG